MSAVKVTAFNEMSFEQIYGIFQLQKMLLIVS